MVTLTAVCKLSDGFGIKSFKVKSLDMNEIAKQFGKQISGWGFNPENCEIYRYDSKKDMWYFIAKRTGRGWVRIATYVENWDKFATPSYRKSAIDLR